MIFLGLFLRDVRGVVDTNVFFVFRHPIRVCCATDYTTSGGDEAYEGPPREASGWSPGPVIRYIKEGML
jgi:hypothetical protein